MKNQDPNPPAQFPWQAYGPFDPKYDPVWQAGYAPPANSIASYVHEPSPTALGGDLGAILDQGRQLAEYQIGLLDEEMGQRRRIKESIMYDIYQDQLTLKNIVLLRGEDLWDKYRMRLEESILNLESEKRRELNSYFRDLMWLGRERRQSLVEAREEEQKTSWLQ